MKKNIWMSIIALLVIGLVGLTIGCGEEKPADNNTPPVEKVYLTIKGSDTMVNLCANWAESYMKTNSNADISVNGGGSGVGVAALINGTTDIASSSREMKKEEIEDAKKIGHEVVENLVALDGISIIVNPGNPIEQLTMEQLMKIYTGEVTNWKQVGGLDMQIILLSRENSSGTYAFFQEHVLLKKDFATSARLLPSTQAIVDGVVADKGSIGYVGLAYAEQASTTVKIVAVMKDSNSQAVKPSITTVKDKSYPIARALYLYTITTSSDAVKTFVEWCKSTDGQTVVTESGYITVQ